MADFTPIATMVKGPSIDPAQVTGLVNMGRVSQQFQKEQELLPYEIEAGKAQSATTQTQSESTKFDLLKKKQGSIASGYVSMINDPLIVEAERNPSAVDSKKLADAMMKWGKQQGAELGIDSRTVSQLTQPYVDMALTRPDQLRNYLKQRHILGLDNALRTEAIGGVAPNVGGNQQAPSGAPMNAPAGGGNAPGSKAPTLQLPYPVRQAGQPYNQLPSEPKDLAEGQSYRDSLVKRQTNLPTSKRNIEEVIKKANELQKEEWGDGAGFLGMAGRNLSTFLGTEQGIRYKELSKDLANAAIANIQAVGGSMDTVSGQQLTRMANGDETFPPKVLIEIARRTQADMTNLDMQASGAQKFAQKFGDNNMKAFQQQWSANAGDGKVFQVINISNDPNLNQDQKQKMVNKLLGEDKKERDKFNIQYLNIKKLTDTGSL
jgi:hypothetical protein